MIVHPDFADHWKTKEFTELTGDPVAPMMVIRLWGYCQIQKASVFPETPDLHKICRSKLSTEELRNHLVKVRFARIGPDGEFIVHDWERCNRILRNSWNNGSQGGRPNKTDQNHKPTGSKTHGFTVQKKKNRKEKVGYLTHGFGKTDPLPEKERLDNQQKFGAQLRGLVEKLRSPTAESSGTENLRDRD